MVSYEVRVLKNCEPAKILKGCSGFFPFYFYFFFKIKGMVHKKINVLISFSGSLMIQVEHVFVQIISDRQNCTCKDTLRSDKS